MKVLRLLLAGVSLVGATWLLTTYGPARLLDVFRPLVRRSAVWSDPIRVHGAGVSADEQNNIDIYKNARQATVYITSTVVRRDSFFFQPVASRNLGSGFLINESGFILTNYHVISGSRQIQVTMSDQSVYNAQPLDTDRSDDLALIKITPKKKVAALRLGDSDHIQVGQKVLAIGNPFGLEGTLTTGIISSIGRAIQAENGNRIEGMIQTDAAINGGNSGGPLLDSAGNVVGINTAIVGQTNVGIGFALPVNRAKALLSDYQAGRVTERPKLGVRTSFVAGDLANALRLPSQGGLLIQQIVPGGSADRAGLRGPTDVVYVGNDQLGVGGDFIVSIEGQPMDREDALVRALAHKRVGDTAEVTVFRNGQTVKVAMKLLRAPEESEGN